MADPPTTHHLPLTTYHLPLTTYQGMMLERHFQHLNGIFVAGFTVWRADIAAIAGNYGGCNHRAGAGHRRKLSDVQCGGRAVVPSVAGSRSGDAHLYLGARLAGRAVACIRAQFYRLARAKQIPFRYR